MMAHASICCMCESALGWVVTFAVYMLSGMSRRYVRLWEMQEYGVGIKWHESALCYMCECLESALCHM